MSIERNQKVLEIFHLIKAGKINEANEKVKLLNENYDISTLSSSQINELTTMFEFPFNKKVSICIHDDSIVLSYPSGYYHEGKEITGVRMFFYYDAMGMIYLEKLLTYLKVSVAPCSDCCAEEEKSK